MGELEDRRAGPALGVGGMVLAVVMNDRGTRGAALVQDATT